jgi:hypothetical protein
MPTAARLKYLAKQAAKKSDLLSDTDRQSEYDKVMSQLTQISSPEIDKFEALIAEWVKDAKVRQGVIPIPSIRRALCYSLGISRSRTFVSLRSDEPEKYANTEKLPVARQQTATTNPTDNTGGEDEEMPQLVSPTSSETTPIVSSSNEPNTATPTEPTPSVNQTSNQPTIQQAQKAKKKKQPVFAQSAPRGSRNASRPPPAMKPKAQSA